MRNPKYQELKDWLKTTTKEIRKQKAEHKNSQREGRYDLKMHRCLAKLQRECRHRHIAYSELRGRNRNDIEPKVKFHKEGLLKGKPINPVDEDYIQKIKNEVLDCEPIIEVA